MPETRIEGQRGQAIRRGPPIGVAVVKLPCGGGDSEWVSARLSTGVAPRAGAKPRTSTSAGRSRRRILRHTRRQNVERAAHVAGWRMQSTRRRPMASGASTLRSTSPRSRRPRSWTTHMASFQFTVSELGPKNSRLTFSKASASS